MASSDAQIEIEEGNLIILIIPDDPKPFKLWTGNQVGDCIEQLYEGPTLSALYAFLKRRKT